MLIRRPAGAFREGRWRKNQTTAMVNADKPRWGACHSGQSQQTRRPLLEMWLPADPQSVPAARHQALVVCREAGVKEEDCFQLDIALGEALANAVVHGAPADPPSISVSPTPEICLCIWNFRNRLIIEVHDHGPGFDPPPPPYAMPPAEAQETHGRGLPLMEMLTDALIVCRGNAEEGGASVYLIKNMVS